MHGRGGVPDHGIVAARLADDSRAWGIVREPSLLETMTRDDVIGGRVTIQADGTALW
jgi:hypothetical protein